jgi:PmbA protein
VHLEAGDVGTAFSSDEERFGIRVRVGGATGFGATNDGSPEALDLAIESSIALARVTPADPLDDLAEPRRVSGVAELRDPELEGLEIEALGRLAGQLAERTRELDSRVRIDSGWVSCSSATFAVASSTGVEAMDRETGADAVLFGMAVDGEKVSSFDVESAQVCGLAEFRSELEGLPDRFVANLVTALDAGSGESFRGSLVLSREAVAEFLLPSLVGSLSAQAVRMGRSRLAEKLGEGIASPCFELVDDGTLAGRPGSGSFDREGLPHARLPLVEAGVLRSFLYTAREARAAERKAGSTGHAVGGSLSPPSVGSTNLLVGAGDADDEALVREVERGVLLRRFAGNADPVSGDFSGVAKGSFLLRKGEAPRPIQETLISGNLFELLQAISGVGRERRWVDGSVLTPLLRLEGVSVTAG